MKKTYDVRFDDDESSNTKGFKMTKKEAIDYIKGYNGSNHSYFKDYKGGVVSVVCKETGEVVYSEEVI
jgi:hypothetical protein